MAKYVVEMMDWKNYDSMMCGGHYHVTKMEIEANSVEEAIATAKALKPNYEINEKCVRTVEEIEAEKKAWVEELEREEEKKRQQALAKVEREKAKAEEMGMTLEEYKAYKKELANRKRIETEIRKAKEKIAELQKEIARLERKLK